MNKYIIELLKLESTVIIPNFGALMKSGKSLIFNSILKYNDGKLEKYIAEQENMEIQDVSNALAKYVREIIAVIEKGEEFLIVGIGSFYKAESGKVALKIEGNSNNETVAEETPISTEPKKENIVTSLYKEKPVKKEEANTPTENDLIKSVSTKKIKEEEKKEPIKVTPTPKKENIVKNEVIKPETKKETIKPIAKTTKVKETKTKKEKKKKKGAIWLIILLLILAGGGTYIGLNLEKIKGFVGLSESQENTEIVDVNNENIVSDNENEIDPEEELMVIDSAENIEDSTFLEEEEIINPEEEEIEENVINVEENTNEFETNESLIYHVIVGAFGDENNAKNLVDKLKKDGFNTAKIVGKTGSLYKVAASCHATKQEAINAIEKAKSINKDAFVEKIK